tara:strand:+ start:2169 stop:2759 length:591 start_codon:yes stop_codon:yes gene_type:complete
MILLLSVKINDSFDTFFTVALQNTPQPINLSVDTTPQKDRINLKWGKDVNIDNFYVIMYKNNIGPHIITLPKISDSQNDDSLSHHTYEFTDVQMNVDYRFAILGENNSGVNDIDKFVKVKLTPLELDVQYVTDVRSKLVCKPDGSYEMKKNCDIDTEIVQAQTVDEKGNFVDFDNNYNEQLMREMNYSPKLKLNFL